VEIPRLTSIKITASLKRFQWIAPTPATVGLLEVDVSELVSGIGDEDGAEPILDVL
jgi:hypothetical protein